MLNFFGGQNDEIFLWQKWWNVFVTKILNYVCDKIDGIFLWPTWWTIFIPKVIMKMKWLNNFEEKKNNYLKVLTIYCPQRVQQAEGISKGLVISWSWLSLTTLVIARDKMWGKSGTFYGNFEPQYLWTGDNFWQNSKA